MGELNEHEARNILRAREWAFDSGTMKSTDPLEEPYLRELHHRMFDNVRKWAGIDRQMERKIGYDPKEIVQQIPQLLANTRYSILAGQQDLLSRRSAGSLSPPTHQNLSVLQMATDVARVIAVVVAVKYGREFTWGTRKDLVAQGDARTRYLAALRTLDANENDVKSVLELVRS